jgi:omega-6 fatty acid desaturase (delta-12 desaturase)
LSHQTSKGWRQAIAPFERSSVARSVWQIVNTVFPFFLAWFLAYKSLSISYWLTLPLTVVTAGLMVRIFILFHDCCHGSFFKNRTANDIVGTLTGILTFSPYRQWRYSHNVHHATSGNLDKHGLGDIWTVTVEEYLAFSPLKRLGYRLYRNPIVMFVIGPAFIFLIQYRFNRRGAGMKERLNTYIINAGIVAAVAAMCWAIGWQAFLLVQGPVFFIAGAAGVWLFYVQHQFEGAYFENQENWDYVQAALQGSSFYRLPKVLQWFTGSIGFHHIHHLSPRVPNYMLEKAHKENEMFQAIEPVTLWTSLRSLGFRIWDEDRKKLVGFGYIKQFQAARANQDHA